MKLGLTSWSLRDCSLTEAAAIARVLKFEALDLGYFYRPALDKAALLRDPDRAAADIAALGIATPNLYHLFGDSVADRNLADPRHRAANEADFRQVVTFCRTAGIGSVFVLPGIVNAGQSREAALAQSAASLNALLPIAQDAGVILTVEAHVHSLAQAPSVVLDLLDRVPGLRLTLDYAHFVCCGYRQEEVDMLAAHAAHVHLRQARPGSLQAKAREGTIDIEAMLGTLRDAGYDGVLSDRIRPSGLHGHAARRRADGDDFDARPGACVDGIVNTALVTGGAGGIGAEVARRLAADGFDLVVADLDGDAAARVAAPFGRGIAIDISDEASVEAAFRAVGSLAVLVNCAGIHLQKLVIDTSAAEWDRIQTVNARGPFLTCRAAARAMMPAGTGRIINIATRLGFGNPYSSAYMASKNALWGFTQCLAVELAGYGITVNAVAPGHVGPGTGMERQFREKAEKLGLTWDAFEAQVLKTIPLGRWCRPADVAAAVSYVASPGASFVTGELINVTGGFVGYGIAPPREPA